MRLWGGLLTASLALLPAEGAALQEPGPAEVPPDCLAPIAFAAVAQRNAYSLDTLEWSPFGAPETGWAAYAPRIAEDIGARCGPASPEFAARLGGWQAAQGLAPDGDVNPTLLMSLKDGWQARRPFIAVRALGQCPLPPPGERLVTAPQAAAYMGKEVQLRADAYKALRRMQAAARRELEDRQALRLFSGYRSPGFDDERCAREQNCQGLVRAQCSAHRTGLAADLEVGNAPDYGADDSAAPNRLFQSGTPAYRWLVRNAHRFGFVNYVYEPWHWEWTGGDF